MMYNPARVLIGSSNLNLAPKDALRFNAADYTDFLVMADFDEAPAGFEWSTIRLPAAERAGRLLAEQGLLSGLHESFREEGFLDVAKAALKADVSSAVSGAQVVAGFPMLDKSYAALEKVQARGQQKLPLIVHPAGQYLAGRAPRRPRQYQPAGVFGEIWYQPTAEWARDQLIPLDSWDVAETAGALQTVQRRLGLDGIALDIHHLLSTRDGVRFTRPVELAAALAQTASFREVQLSLRPDFGGDADIVRLAASGSLHKTQHGDVLAAIQSTVPASHTVRVVSEIAASEISRLELGHYTAVHAAINNSVRAIFS